MVLFAGFVSVVVHDHRPSRLERVRAVRADREEHLKEQLVGDRIPIAVAGAPVLAAQLAEFARPVCQDCRESTVSDARVACPLGPVESTAGEPTSLELVLGRGIQSEGRVGQDRLLAATPNQLRPGDERTVNRALQLLPPERQLRAILARQEIAARIVVAARVRDAGLEV